jgi:hypothetical protein
MGYTNFSIGLSVFSFGKRLLLIDSNSTVYLIILFLFYMIFLLTVYLIIFWEETLAQSLYA